MFNINKVDVEFKAALKELKKKQQEEKAKKVLRNVVIGLVIIAVGFIALSLFI